MGPLPPPRPPLLAEQQQQRRRRHQQQQQQLSQRRQQQQQHHLLQDQSQRQRQSQSQNQNQDQQQQHQQPTQLPLSPDLPLLPDDGQVHRNGGTSANDDYPDYNDDSGANDAHDDANDGLQLAPSSSSSGRGADDYCYDDGSTADRHLHHPYPAQIDEPLHASTGHPYYRPIAGASSATTTPFAGLSARPQSASSLDSGYSTAPALMDQATTPSSTTDATPATAAAAAAAAAAAVAASLAPAGTDPRQLAAQQAAGQSIPISSLISHEQAPTPPPAVQTRPRQACIPCRRKKVGCDLRREDSGGPPCLRCQHEKQECVVPPPENTFENPSPQELPSIKDLACPHCSLVFLRDHDLRAHLRTQCQEKHYVCPTCQARFRRLNDLDRHLRIHTGERPHVCDICGRRFSRATTLSRHRQGPDGCAGRRADLGKRRFDRPPGALGQGQHVIQQRLPSASGFSEGTPPR